MNNDASWSPLVIDGFKFISDIEWYRIVIIFYGLTDVILTDTNSQDINGYLVLICFTFHD